jgi:hypothetical protein
MANYKKLLLLAFALLTQLYVIAQNTATTTNTTDVGFMRSEGKIYVVMLVVITILAGLLLYIVRLDKKISKLEKGGNV